MGGLRMHERPLAGLATFLDALSRAPHPDEVATAMVEGPGSLLGATAATVLWAREPHLVILGSHGYQRPEVDGLTWIDMYADFPLSHTYWEQEPIILRNADVSDAYVAMRRPESRWGHLNRRMPDGDNVSAPILSQGRCWGSYALACDESREWSSLDVAVLDAMSHALGMWLTHPDSGVTPDAEHMVDSIDLTERQTTILQLMASGRTNLAISHALQVSVSTVKQEIARILTQLDAPDRQFALARAETIGLLDDEVNS